MWYHAASRSQLVPIKGHTHIAGKLYTAHVPDHQPKWPTVKLSATPLNCSQHFLLFRPISSIHTHTAQRLTTLHRGVKVLCLPQLTCNGSLATLSVPFVLWQRQLPAFLRPQVPSRRILYCLLLLLGTMRHNEKKTQNQLCQKVTQDQAAHDP